LGVVLLVALAVAGTAAWAAAPFDGIYKSSLGDFNEGREGSSWRSAFLGQGNVLHAESWDGSTLGTDWKILCPEAVKVILIVDLAPGGTGQRIYQIIYSGGYLELDGGGPWGNGDPLYTSIILTYNEIRTIQYVNNVMIGSVSDHSLTSHMAIYKKCFAWAIGNGVWLGNTDAAPAGYPVYRRQGCVGLHKPGHYGDVRDLTLTIQGCTVSTQTSTWGAVKAIYR
jgi:hypothetical protein